MIPPLKGSLFRGALLAVSALTAGAASASEAVQHGAAAHGAEDHGHALFLGQGAEFYVSLGIALFIAFLVFKVKAHKLIAAQLDARIAQTRAQLDEARKLRDDAEALLADYRQKQANAEAQARQMLDHARTEADAIVAEARTNAQALIARRQKMAEDRIAASQRDAEQDVRAAVVREATAMARQIIASRLDGANADRLVDQAIADLDRRLH